MPKKIDIRAFLIDKEEHIEQAARAMKAMAHPLRLKILCVLGNQEVSVQGIVDSVGTSQSNISQHLAILRDKGVLPKHLRFQPAAHWLSTARYLAKQWPGTFNTTPISP